MPEETILTPQELADRWKVDRRTIYRYVSLRRDPLPHSKIGGVYRFNLSEVEEWGKRKVKP